MKKLICYIAFIAFASFVCAQQKVTIEAPSPDPTLVVRGPEKEILCRPAILGEGK